MVRFRQYEPTGVGLTTGDRRDGGIAGFALWAKIPPVQLKRSEE